MICLKCGNELKDNEQICGVCGYNKNTIENNDNPFGIKNQGIYNQNPVDKEKAQEILDHQKQFQQLTEIYIGSMYYNFKKGSFSWCAFFLGAIYTLYRKMIGISIILICLNIATIYIFQNNLILFWIVQFIICLFLGLNFKKIYFNDCIEKTAKIKKNNPDKGYNQLTEIVKVKGGVNILYPILAMIIIAAITLILYETTGYQIPQPQFRIPIKVIK